MLLSLLKRLAAWRSPAPVPDSAQPIPSKREAMLAMASRLLKQGEFPRLIALCEARLADDREDADALVFLASAFAAQGELERSIAALRRAHAVRPTSGEIRLTLARLLLRDGQMENAIDAYEQALRCSVVAEIACVELTRLLNQLGRYDDAEHHASSLAESHAVQRELASSLFERGKLDDAIRILRLLVENPNVSPSVHSDLLRTLNYTDSHTPEEIFQEHRRWALRHASPFTAQPVRFANSPDPDRRLRIGFISPHFRKHAVTFFFESVLAEFEPAQFEIVLYSDAVRPDEYSARLRAHATLWRDVAQLSDEQIAALVRSDGVDILIDLSGHTPGHRLLAFARKPAPVQMTWNGYPNTTGMDAMLYRITDASCDPPGETEHLHSERLVRLPSIYMSWRPPRNAPDVSPLPCERTGRVTFASFNACYKLTDSILQLWSAILARIPSSRLLLLAVPTVSTEQRIRDIFERLGTAPNRLDIRGRLEHEAFLAVHSEADIALDPFPYHGTTTTCFALWMGVPVVSLCGRTHVSRVGSSLLANVGLSNLVASDREDYIRIACDLASDAARLADIRQGLRTRMLASALTDGAACAKALQHTWRSAWTEWCAASARVKSSS